MKDLVYLVVGFIIWNKPLGLKFYWFYFYNLLLTDRGLYYDITKTWKKHGLSKRQMGEQWIITHTSWLIIIFRDFIFMPIVIGLIIAVSIFAFF